MRKMSPSEQVFTITYMRQKTRSTSARSRASSEEPRRQEEKVAYKHAARRGQGYFN
jgi:hypothetical protein